MPPISEEESSSCNKGLLNMMNTPMWFRIKGTVILRIWKQVLFVLIYTTILVLLHIYIPEIRIEFSQTLIGLLGIVLALLLAFRTQSAYDVYSEGRNLWSKMTIDLRTLCMCIWIGVKENEGKDVIGKLSFMNLLLAYAISMKHHLREEYSTDFDDTKDLLNHLPQFLTPPQSSNQIKKGPTTMKYTAHVPPTLSNIPLEILYYIQSYITNVTSNNQLDSSVQMNVQFALTGLINCLTNFEKILNTPLPLAYSVHLQHILWIFILSMPFQLIGDLLWWTIPVVGLTAFSLLGILGINWEIDNPFGYDYNDLPLDDYCKVLRQEIQLICWNKSPPVDDWILSNKNFPMKPICTFNAHELSTKSVEQLYQILFKCGKSPFNKKFKSQPATGTGTGTGLDSMNFGFVP